MQEHHGTLSALHLQAHTAEEKAEAIEQAVDRLSCTLDWLSSQPFLTSAQMEQWSGLVRAYQQAHAEYVGMGNFLMVLD